MKPGARSGSFTIISDADVERIYQAALDLLMEPGFFSESDLFLDLFAEGGAKVDRTARTIRVPKELVEWALVSVPKSFTLYGRNDPSMDLQVELGRTYYGMGGTSEPQYWDFDLRRSRQPTKQDMIHNASVPRIDVDPETYEVRADGELLTCEPASELPLAQRYFLF